MTNVNQNGKKQMHKGFSVIVKNKRKLGRPKHGDEDNVKMLLLE